MAFLAAGAAGLSDIEAAANTISAPVRRARVTVLRRDCDLELQSLYLADPEAGPCRAFEAGEEFEWPRGCGEGFCPRAREVVERCVELASHCPQAPDGTRSIIAACPDGTRPVIFRIEL